MSGHTDLLSKYEIEIREKLVHTMLTHYPAPYVADTLIEEAKKLTDFILDGDKTGNVKYSPVNSHEATEYRKYISDIGHVLLMHNSEMNVEESMKRAKKIADEFFTFTPPQGG